MELKVNLHLTASPELMAALSGLVGAVPTQTQAAPVINLTEPKKDKKEQTAKTAKPSDNGAAAKVDLSTIRQWAAKSEANKAAARELLKTGFNVEKLTDLPAESYADFWAQLQNDL